MSDPKIETISGGIHYIDVDGDEMRVSRTASGTGAYVESEGVYVTKTFAPDVALAILEAAFGEGGPTGQPEGLPAGTGVHLRSAVLALSSVIISRRREEELQAEAERAKAAEALDREADAIRLALYGAHGDDGLPWESLGEGRRNDYRRAARKARELHASTTNPSA